MTARLSSEGKHNNLAWATWLNSSLGHLAGLDVLSHFHPVIKVCDQDSLVLNKSLRERQKYRCWKWRKPLQLTKTAIICHLRPRCCVFPQQLAHLATECAWYRFLLDTDIRRLLLRAHWDSSPPFKTPQIRLQFKLNSPHCHCSAWLMMLLSKFHVWMKPLFMLKWYIHQIYADNTERWWGAEVISQSGWLLLSVATSATISESGRGSSAAEGMFFGKPT